MQAEHVYGRNAAGDLIHYFWSTEQTWTAENLTQRGNIGTDYRIASDPAVDQFPEGDVPTQHVFARNANGDLIQYWWNPQQSWAAENLTQRGNIGTDYRIASDPAVGNFPMGGAPKGGLDDLVITDVIALTTQHDTRVHFAVEITNVGSLEVTGPFLVIIHSTNSVGGTMAGQHIQIPANVVIPANGKMSGYVGDAERAAEQQVLINAQYTVETAIMSGPPDSPTERFYDRVDIWRFGIGWEHVRDSATGPS